MTSNLYEAEKHKKYVVVGIDSGIKAKKRLGELGILKGIIIEKIEMVTHGPIKIKVGESNYALGRGITKKILVKENENQKNNKNIKKI